MKSKNPFHAIKKAVSMIAQRYIEPLHQIFSPINNSGSKMFTSKYIVCASHQHFTQYETPADTDISHNRCVYVTLLTHALSAPTTIAFFVNSLFILWSTQYKRVLLTFMPNVTANERYI